MTRPIFLALAVALLGADAASAATLQASYNTSSSPIRPARMQRAVRVSHRPHRIRLSEPQLRTATLGAPGEFVRVADNDDSRDGWFKSRHEAGWGVSQGSTQMVAGLYQRPQQPDIPGPQTQHTQEGRGAAGLSLSLKLGQ